VKTPLAGLQADFQRYLLDGEGRFAEEVRGGGRLDAGTRLGIYFDAYRLRLIEALETDFIALRALLGGERFERLCRAYIAAHPSDHYSLRHFGRHMARFLADSAPWQGEPFLAELALFEWALVDAFDAADSPAARTEDMATIDPERWPQLVFRAHASVQRLNLSWNAPAIWSAARDGEPLPDPQRAPHPLGWVVWRQGLQNYYRPLSVDEAFALDTLLRGEHFGAICEGLCEWIDPQNVAGYAATLLKLWLNDGLIREIASG
jgi:hypothetical protein